MINHYYPQCKSIYHHLFEEQLDLQRSAGGQITLNQSCYPMNPLGIQSQTGSVGGLDQKFYQQVHAFFNKITCNGQALRSADWIEKLLEQQQSAKQWSDLNTFFQRYMKGLSDYVFQDVFENILLEEQRYQQAKQSGGGVQACGPLYQVLMNERKNYVPEGAMTESQLIWKKKLVAGTWLLYASKFSDPNFPQFSKFCLP